MNFYKGKKRSSVIICSALIWNAGRRWYITVSGRGPGLILLILCPQLYKCQSGVCSFCWNFEWTHKNLEFRRHRMLSLNRQLQCKSVKIYRAQTSQYLALTKISAKRAHPWDNPNISVLDLFGWFKKLVLYFINAKMFVYSVQKYPWHAGADSEFPRGGNCSNFKLIQNLCFFFI